MKKACILFVTALVLCLSFTSCSKDDDSSTTASVEGKWNFDKYTLIINGVTTPTQDYDDNEAGCSKDFFNFAADGVLYEGEYDTDCMLESNTGSWSQNNKTITVILDGETTIFTIESLSDSVLKVKTTYSEDESNFSVVFTLIKA